MHSKSRDHSIRQHAIGAALMARNAVAAEMAVAGRAAHAPSDAVWAFAVDELLRSPDRADPAFDARALALAVPLRPGPANSETVAIRKPAARRRHELLEMCVWFAVGGLGGLLVLAAVRLVEALVR